MPFGRKISDGTHNGDLREGRLRTILVDYTINNVCFVRVQMVHKQYKLSRSEQMNCSEIIFANFGKYKKYTFFAAGGDGTSGLSGLSVLSGRSGLGAHPRCVMDW
jgi:hypothetical protein